MQTKLFAIGALSIAATQAHAHLEMGKYVGKDSYGMECSFEVKGVDFAYGIHHPLNERVDVMFGPKHYLLQHLPQIDLEKKTVRPEKEVLTGVAGTTIQSEALILKMSHAPGKEGPTELVFVKQDPQYPGNSETNVCGGLKHVE